MATSGKEMDAKLSDGSTLSSPLRGAPARSKRRTQTYGESAQTTTKPPSLVAPIRGPGKVPEKTGVLRPACTHSSGPSGEPDGAKRRALIPKGGWPASYQVIHRVPSGLAATAGRV